MKNIIRITCLLSVIMAMFGCEKEQTYYVPTISASITIEQKGNQVKDQLTVTFKPSGSADKFSFAIGNESDREAFENGTMTGIIYSDDSEELTHTFSYLDPDKYYTIFAIAYNAEGKSGAVASKVLRTFSGDFDAEIRFLTDKAAAFTVTVSDKYYKYDYALAKAEDKQAFEDGSFEGIESKIEGTPYFTNTFFDLTPNTNYVFYVRATDRSDIKTHVIEIPVRTLIEDMCPGISFKVNSIDLYTGNLTYTLNNLCGGIGVMVEDNSAQATMINTNWRGDIYSMLQAWANVQGQLLLSNNREVNVERTTAGLLVSGPIALGGRPDPFDYPFTTYVLLYDKDGKPFGVDKFDYKTPSLNAAALDAEPLSITIDNKSTPGVARYDLEFNEHTKYVLFETFTADYIDGKNGNPPTEKEIYEHLAGGYFIKGTGPAYLNEKVSGYTGQDLYLIVAPMNENGLYHGVKKLLYYRYTAN